MASTASEIIAFMVSISGWVLVSSTLPTDYWKVSTIDGTVITTATYWANLWKTCVTDSTGVSNCKDFPSMLALDGLHPLGPCPRPSLLPGQAAGRPLGPTTLRRDSPAGPLRGQGPLYPQSLREPREPSCPSPPCQTRVPRGRLPEPGTPGRERGHTWVGDSGVGGGGGKHLCSPESRGHSCGIPISRGLLGHGVTLVSFTQHSPKELDPD